MKSPVLSAAALAAALLAAPAAADAGDARAGATRLAWIALVVLAPPRERVDLNRASAGEIAASVPGIAPGVADRIVAWRTRHGRFDSYLDLLEVPGMDGATIARSRHRIVL